MVSAAMTWVNSQVAVLALLHQVRDYRPVWQATHADGYILTLHCERWSASATFDRNLLDDAFGGDEGQHATLLRTIRTLVRALAVATTELAK